MPSTLKLIFIKGSDFSWIKGNTTLQISLHSLDEKRRDELIPFKNKMTIEELGQIRTNSNLKTTVNLTLVDTEDFDIEKLYKYFDPKYFFTSWTTCTDRFVLPSNMLSITPSISKSLFRLFLTKSIVLTNWLTPSSA